MNVGRSYKLSEFLVWTRRKIYVLLALAAIPVVIHQGFGQKWIGLPWAVAALLGTAASFIVGFKNAQTYNRTLEAQQAWASIASTSRYWGLLSRDFPLDPQASKALIDRHLAWLTALRYGLRSSRVWESAAGRSNSEHRRKFYRVPEEETSLETELCKCLPQDQLAALMREQDKPGQLMRMQSRALRALVADQQLSVAHQLEMQKTMKDFLDQQGKVERIKNAPYPRQYATINTIFVWCFAAVLPFCMVREFDRLGAEVPMLLGFPLGWLALPFSVLIAWMYLALDQVGESTENPFEGGANDVPIAQVCRAVEIDLRDLLGETALPEPLAPQNRIIL